MKHYDIWVLYDIDSAVMFTEVGLEDKVSYDDLRLFSFGGRGVEIHFLLTKEQVPSMFFGEDDHLKEFLLDRGVKQHRYDMKAYRSKKGGFLQNSHIIESTSGTRLTLLFDKGQFAAWLHSPKGKRLDLKRKDSWARQKADESRGDVAFPPEYYKNLNNINDIKWKHLYSGKAADDHMTEEVTHFLENRKEALKLQQRSFNVRVALFFIVVVVILFYSLGGCE